MTSKIRTQICHLHSDETTWGSGWTFAEWLETLDHVPPQDRGHLNKIYKRLCQFQLDKGFDYQISRDTPSVRKSIYDTLVVQEVPFVREYLIQLRLFPTFIDEQKNWRKGGVRLYLTVWDEDGCMSYMRHQHIKWRFIRYVPTPLPPHNPSLQEKMDCLLQKKALLLKNHYSQ